ncbi:MAG: ATP-binding protein [Cyanobacteriota bacterium]
MNRILGDFKDELPVSQEGLTIVFSPTSLPLQQRWRNNGLSADFMADYFATFFPGCENDSPETGSQAELKSAVSFIANELLENAMKFNDEASPHPISIRLQMDRHVLVFVATNSVNLQASEKFQTFIKKLLNSDPSELYIHHLEKDGQENSNSVSGLGLLTMVNDYCAKLGWKFETLPESPDVITVTTMVQLTL